MQLRNCSALLPSLLSLLRAACDSGKIGYKAVELCVCSVRNLCYSLQEVSDPAYEVRQHQQQQHSIKPVLKIFGHAKSAKHKPDAVSVPDLSRDSTVALLWQPATITSILKLLRNSSNPVTLEAAAGTIQNLTAGDWTPSRLVRAEVRKQNGLQLLITLLKASLEKISCAAASALRNLTLEEETRQALGQHSLAFLLMIELLSKKF
ncbi:hypothetical protein Ciccas_009292 [Cichlidogyrus casuarinus]|uniref:Uncharacterized protein n=1 Tax=Cichlidogyrus casuarinus TaxID=1844966 RepID=A0ABD2PYF9_9PLAT